MQIIFKALPNALPVVSGGQKITMEGTKLLSFLAQNGDNKKPYELLYDVESLTKLGRATGDGLYT